MSLALAGGRLRAYGIGWGATLAVLWPMFGAVDSFPLSNFPMFSRPRGQPVLHSMLAVDARGREYTVPNELVGSDEVLQAKVLLDRAVQGGSEEMGHLCEQAAARLAAAPASAGRGALPEPGAWARIDIVANRYDPVQYFLSGPAPIERTRLHSCAVGAGTAPRRKRAKAAGSSP